MAKASYDAPAARNAIRLIELLCSSDSPLGVREICRQLKLNSNMVFRLLKTLQKEQWIVASADGTTYSMGLRPYHYISKSANKMSVMKAAHAPLRKLWEDTKESCYLGVRDGTRTLFLEHLDAVGDIRIAASPGGRFLMHCAAPGKVLMAYAGDDAISHIIETEGLPKQTKNTIGSTAKLRKELAKIRNVGHAVDLEEYAEGLICYAAPVFDHSGEVVATVGLSVLTLYYNPQKMIKELGPKVLAAARAISVALGAVANGG